jgi:hypothetical protein
MRKCCESFWRLSFMLRVDNVQLSKPTILRRTRARVRRKPHRSPRDICRLQTDGYRGQTSFLDFEIRVRGEKVFEVK